ncbi:ribosome rescue protein RqcH [Halococcus sediminicola]|uniref:ribosome rescue protein RqcH n=1 Tax=Halococcus sediminicola TaxID=1264579 RepID=UPI000679181A|nr:ribosome rescue protein RqcH [Halococcus sediminicola]
MNPKRELTSVDLAALVTELGSYAGAKLDKAYLYGDDLLRLKLRDFERGRVELMIEVGETKRAHVVSPEHVPDAPGRPPGFAKMLRNRLSGADFAGVSQFGFDRILTFEFEREDRNTQVVAELFGEGNIAVLDATGEVVDCLNTVRLQSRTVAPGAQYEFPSSRFDPLAVEYEGFVARMEESNTDLVRTLATQLNFGGLYGEELCTRAGVEKELAIEEAGEQEFEALYDALERLAEQLSSGDFDPRIYRDDGEPVDVTPFALEERAGLDSEEFDSFTAALDAYFVELDTTEDEESGGRDRPDFEDDIERQKRIIDQQEGAIEDFDAQSDRERAKAESLYANYELVDEVLSTVRNARAEGIGWEAIDERFAEGSERGIPAAEAVTGVEPSEGTVTMEIDDRDVELDPQEGVEQNADRLYREAKRVVEKKEGAEEAVAETRAELEEIERRREQWEAGDVEDDSDEESEDIDWLSRRSIPVRKNEQWYERFRWFHTTDGFLVLGGRNADQNEDLVKKYLDRGDRFFHTQVQGGPVTVLKATGPSEPTREVDIPDRSLEEAAQFAVSYSTVWKSGRFAGDAYMADPDQVSKTPESGEYLEKGGFAIRGDRTYFRDTPVGVAVGITCEPETRVIGGPPAAITDRTETAITVEPGQYAQNDAAKRLYREFREHFRDTSFVRKVASPDLIAEFLPPGGSRVIE